jgi:hypothetical protein
MGDMAAKFLLAATLFLLPIATAYAGPPIERLPLTGITVLGVDDPTSLHANEQVTLSTSYSTVYPNLNYTIIFQILDEKSQVVYLGWIEGYQNDTSKIRMGSYVCGDKICSHMYAALEDYICGDKICQKSPLGPKSAEISWLPTVPGRYFVDVFAWEALDNPTALSPPMHLDVAVV